MVKTLIIGDLHLDNSPPGLLTAQVDAVKKIVQDAGKVDAIVFLGDVFMHRRPFPRTLLAANEMFLSCIHAGAFEPPNVVFILRGNHDSENKSDDGVTALSLYKGICTVVITQTEHFPRWKFSFIPHYEDQDKIKRALSEVPSDHTVFGHFGYYGALNSAGDNDCDLAVSDFSNHTILGHIHKHVSRGNITCLGTPYSTNFTEGRNEHYYATLEDGELTTHSISWGPRHLVIDFEDVEDNLDWINDPEYFTLLRINLSTITEDQEGVASLIDKLKVGYVEVKYKPLFDKDEKFIPHDTVNPVVQIDDDIIEQYIHASTTTLGKEQLLAGLALIHENENNR